MFKRYTLPLLVVLGGMSLSLAPGYNNVNGPSSYSYPQSGMPGMSDELEPSIREATGREEIAYMDERDRDIHQRANRKGDWGYKQNWRYDRDAFYRGETQGEAYDKEHPDGEGGPGMEPDNEYLQMRKFYLEDVKKQNAAAGQRNNSTRSYANDQNYRYQTGQTYGDQISDQGKQYPRANDNSNRYYR